MLDPITRQEKILSGEDLEPITRQEWFLKKYRGGGSGGTSIDVTAQVGQTIVVKEVDANGKPTKWESADYQPRTHWEETTTIKGDTLTWDGNTDGRLIVNDAFVKISDVVLTSDDLKNGYKFSYVFDGVTDERELTEYDRPNNDILVICDGAVICVSTDGASIAEFVFPEKGTYIGIGYTEASPVSLTIPGYNGFETTTTVVKTIPPKYLPEGIGYSEEVEVLPETTVEIDTETGAGALVEAIELSVGKNYIVRWNGTEYNCTAQYYFVPIDEEGNTVNAGVIVGNVDMVLGGEGTGEPFVVVNFFPEFAAEAGVSSAIEAFDGSATVTLSITEVVYHPILEHYVPYAFPYYIDLSFAINEDGTIASGTCNETVSRLEAMYRSGRTLVLRFKRQEAALDEQGNTITNIYEYRWQLAISQSTPLLPGTVFQFANPYVKQGSGGAYVTSAITLVPNEDGTYAVTGVFMN